MKYGITADAPAIGKGFLFKYLRTVETGDFGTYFGALFPEILQPKEISGMMMINDSDAYTHILSYEEWSGLEVILTVRTGVPLPIQARRILITDTTATSIAVWFGQ